MPTFTVTTIADYFIERDFEAHTFEEASALFLDSLALGETIALGEGYSMDFSRIVEPTNWSVSIEDGEENGLTTYRDYLDGTDEDIVHDERVTYQLALQVEYDVYRELEAATAREALVAYSDGFPTSTVIRLVNGFALTNRDVSSEYVAIDEILPDGDRREVEASAYS